MKNRMKKETHPDDIVLADYLSGILPQEGRDMIEAHISDCCECASKVAGAYRVVNKLKKGKAIKLRNINVYLVLAIITFVLSFTLPRYFIQFLVATLIFGVKWVVDSKTQKMLVMIHEAWKNGDKDEEDKIMRRFDSSTHRRP